MLARCARTHSVRKFVIAPERKKRLNGGRKGGRDEARRGEARGESRERTDGRDERGEGE